MTHNFQLCYAVGLVWDLLDALNKSKTNQLRDQFFYGCIFSLISLTDHFNKYNNMYKTFELKNDSQVSEKLWALINENSGNDK